MKAFLFLLLTLLPLHAEEGPFTTLLITVDYVETTPAGATALLHGDGAPASSAEWHQALNNLLTEETSKLVATLSVTTKGGQRATAETVKEKIYPTEFNVAGGRGQQSPAVPPGLSGVDIPTPTAFEMRPIGARLEVDPVIGPDGKSIDLNLAPEITDDLGTEPHMSLPAEGGERPLISMPKFYSMKLTSATTVSDGGTSLLGVLMPPSEHESPDGEKRILCFVTARIVKG